MVTIHWFRQDLRLSDNPALNAAATHGEVLPVFILDDERAGKWAHGSASRWWLHHSLKQLNHALDGKLLVIKGSADTVLPALAAKYNVDAVYWNRCYEPWRIQRDKKIKDTLRSKGVTVNSFNGSLLWEPWTVLKKDKTPYKVFTPYYRRGCLMAPAPREPSSAPATLQLFGGHGQTTIEALDLLPKKGRRHGLLWDHALNNYWSEPGRGVGEAAAQSKMAAFLNRGLNGYKEGRNFPAKAHISKLSPHLHFGEISPNQIWYASAMSGCTESDLDCFHSELGWREFSYYLLYHFPSIPEANFQAKFDRFPWQENFAALEAWQQGLTGVPIVDAGMRELQQTGFMHNRVRMIVGSFLVKNLLQHWHHGEAWFWDQLVDADLASNSASWQWVAGSGADAAPYFRIFNPITQGQKFDPDGDYIRRYIPQIAKLPNKYLFSPWEAPKHILEQAGISLGCDYPSPIVDMKVSRERALASFKQLKG